jgi:hypothetical protein
VYRFGLYNSSKNDIIETSVRWCKMIQYVCDTCLTIKKPDDTWIVGLAAEAAAATAARRELSIQSGWDRNTAVHPLAVHFCSTQCKDEYTQRLFGGEASLDAVDQVIVRRNAPAAVVIERAAPAKKFAKGRAVAKKARSRKKRAA